MMKWLLVTLLAVFLIHDVTAEEESPRDKLVRNSQRVEKAVLKDLGSLREKGCHLLKGQDCVPTKEEAKTEESKENKAN